MSPYSLHILILLDLSAVLDIVVYSVLLFLSPGIAKYALRTESPLAEKHHSGAIGHPLLPG